MTFTLTCSCNSQRIMTAPEWEFDIECAACGRRLKLPEQQPTNSVVVEMRPSTEHQICFVEESSTNLILWDTDSLRFGSLKRRQLKAWIEGISNHDEARDLSALKRIGYESIREIECNLRQTTVDISFASDDSTSSKLIELHDLQSCQRFLELAKAILKDGGTNEVRFYSRLRAAVYPTIGFVVFAVICGLTVWASTNPELDPSKAHFRPGRRKIVLDLFVFVLKLIGWKGLAVVFGGISLLFLIWLVMRLIDPPIKWTLKRTPVDSGAAIQSSCEDLEPVAWIVHRQVADSINREPTAEQTRSPASRVRGNILLYSFLAFIIFLAGSLLVWSNMLAWISNACFLCIHAVTLLFIMYGICRRLWSWSAQESSSILLSYLMDVLRFVVPISLLSLFSAAMLAINPSDHWILSAVVTGISLVGALFEACILKDCLRRFRQQPDTRSG